MVNRFLKAFLQTRVHNRKFSYLHVETGNILGKPSNNDSIAVAHRVFFFETIVSDAALYKIARRF